MRDYLIDSDKLVEKTLIKRIDFINIINNEIRLFLINSLREVADVHLCL